MEILLNCMGKEGVGMYNNFNLPQDDKKDYKTVIKNLRNMLI